MSGKADPRPAGEGTTTPRTRLERGRGALHPQLIHFLQNRSYAKAVMFLGGETDIPVGACGGGRKG